MNAKDKYGEVFTPHHIVQEMLNILPSDIWQNYNYTWMDPACGDGAFCIEVVKRYLDGFYINQEYNPGLTQIIPDRIERSKIISKNIYGIDIQKKHLDTLKNSIESILGTINEDNFINHNSIDFNFNDKTFDVVMGNPPYQKDRLSSSNARATDFYTEFIDLANIISSRYILYITPSRWFNQISLYNFRFKMLYEYKIKILNHFDNPEFFPGTDIKGGVSYFLIDKNYKGGIINNFCDSDIIKDKENMLSTRSSIAIEILNKTKKYNDIQYRVKSKGYYSIKSNDKRFHKNRDINDIKCYVSKYQGSIAYIDKNLFQDQMINQWKILIRSADGIGRDCPTYYILCPPYEICNESYIPILFNSENECKNFITYFQSKLFRFLFSINKSTHCINSNLFGIIPDLDFTESWDDAKIYKYFDINKNEIDYIENNQPINGYAKKDRGF